MPSRTNPLRSFRCFVLCALCVACGDVSALLPDASHQQQPEVDGATTGDGDTRPHGDGDSGDGDRVGDGDGDGDVSRMDGGLRDGGANVDAGPQQPVTRYTELVDPFIGTGGASKNLNCFPGAIVPWGMVSASPDTTPSAGNPSTTNHAAGYLSDDDLIQGFSHTRLQGTSTPDIGCVLLMPAVGSVASLIKEAGYRSKYDKASERAEPGYYAVTLSNPNVRAEMTVTQRTAIHRYNFQSAPPNGEARVVLDVGHAMLNVNVAGGSLDVANGVLEGFTQPNGRFSGPSKGGLKTYFSIRFEPAPTSISTWLNDSVDGSTSRSGAKIGAVATFNLPSGGEVIARVGISYVDVNGARNNRESELKDLSFDTVKQNASDAWQHELASVRFEGGSDDQRTIMATALYHSFVVPTAVTDVDGRYHGYDNANHQANFEYHTNFSMWDTYRTVHPLLSLVRRDRQRNLSRSLIQMAREGGYYPRWSMGHGYPNITAGSPADIVVAESYLKGVDGFDASEALDFMLKEIDNPPPAGHPHSGREGLADYLSKGYVPVGLQVPGVAPRVVVRTLEYNIADGAIANLAHALGRSNDEKRARKWAGSFTTLWDSGNNVFRGKMPDGSWWSPSSFDQFNNNGDLYYGANALQYSWLAPHDMAGLMALHGSKDAFVSHLTTFFQKTADNQGGYYIHDNEPDIHASFLFLTAGRPDLAQKWIDWAAKRYYGTGRDGLPGNEDAGALSAWYVLSALGLYPVTSTDIWLIGRPEFPRVEIDMAFGTLVIDAPDASPDRPYVKSVTLNGQVLAHPWLHHADLTHGGTLHFDMSEQPGEWGTDFGSF